MRMKALWFLLAFMMSACAGVASNPPDPHAWENALDAFATAHCAWNYNCDNRHDEACVAGVDLIMGNQTKPELAPGTEDDCIACMQAWTAVYEADTSPVCSHTLTFDQSQQIQMACMVANCVENHDLPGTSPQ